MSQFWRDRPTFVTGATGLVGSWLVKRLISLGADVVCLVRDTVPRSEFYRQKLHHQVKLVYGDITEQLLLERALGEYEIKTVFHLAAQTIVGIANQNPLSTLESNIRGTYMLLEACRRSPKVSEIVLASSDKAYGTQATLPYTEDTSLQGKHPYDVSKSCSDMIGQMYAHSYQMPVVVTRCGNFFGGGDLNWNRIVPGTIRSILRSEAPVIRSNGQYIRDYFYVQDGAMAYTMLAEKLAENPALRGEAFNFSNEVQITVRELVEHILRLMGSTLEPEIRNEASNEIEHQYLSAAKAQQLLGWRAQYDLEDALLETILWYQDFLRESSYEFS